MPDWFYRTVSQRVLFAMSPARGRDLALGLMGGIARLPGGKYIIDVLGHMVPDARLTLQRGVHSFWTPVGVGLGLDMRAVATKALARFGVGMIEVGPVGSTALSCDATLRRDVAAQSLTWQTAHRLAAADLVHRLPKRRDPRVQTIARLDLEHPDQVAAVVNALRQKVSGFSVVLTNAASQAFLQAVLATGSPVFAVVRAEDAESVAHAHWAFQAGCAGMIVDATLQAPGGAHFAPENLVTAMAATRQLRAALGSQCLLIATGGVHKPADALALLDAGADVIQVDSGMVFSGPGLVKRIDDALLNRLLSVDVSAHTQSQFDRDPQRSTLGLSWFWFLLMGLGMAFGSILAGWIAIQHVLLPYDEVFVGLSKAQLHAVNNRLLDFLTHDRITLAGIMATVGIAYSGLAWFGIRRGWHWAEGTVQCSALIGAASFFLFLGFGYFEPFHGFVTAVLTQFLFAGMRSRLEPVQRMPQPALGDDADWRQSLWGQLCWICFGLGLLGAGAAISIVGITAVFVPEDLVFMGVSADALRSASPRLLPLIAHDRATVGGMLLASGLLYLLPALWGFRAGERWLWWTLVLAAVPAFSAAIGVHLFVGYLDAWHLLPIMPALALFGAGAVLSYRFLHRRVE